MQASELKRLPFFDALDDDQLAAIAPYAQLDQVAEGTALVREGDFSRELTVIDVGTAEVTRGGEKVAELGPGDFFGEIGLLAHAMRNATVTASSPMTTVSLSSFDVRRLRKQFPDLVERIQQVGDERAKSE